MAGQINVANYIKNQDDIQVVLHTVMFRGTPCRYARFTDTVGKSFKDFFLIKETALSLRSLYVEIEIVPSYTSFVVTQSSKILSSELVQLLT